MRHRGILSPSAEDEVVPLSVGAIIPSPSILKAWAPKQSVACCISSHCDNVPAPMRARSFITAAVQEAC